MSISNYELLKLDKYIKNYFGKPVNIIEYLLDNKIFLSLNNLEKINLLLKLNETTKIHNSNDKLNKQYIIEIFLYYLEHNIINDNYKELLIYCIELNEPVVLNYYLDYINNKKIDIGFLELLFVCSNRKNINSEIISTLFNYNFLVDYSKIEKYITNNANIFISNNYFNKYESNYINSNNIYSIITFSEICMDNYDPMFLYPNNKNIRIKKYSKCINNDKVKLKIFYRNIINTCEIILRNNRVDIFEELYNILDLENVEYNYLFKNISNYLLAYTVRYSYENTIDYIIVKLYKYINIDESHIKIASKYNRTNYILYFLNRYLSPLETHQQTHQQNSCININSFNFLINDAYNNNNFELFNYFINVIDYKNMINYYYKNESHSIISLLTTPKILKKYSILHIILYDIAMSNKFIENKLKYLKALLKSNYNLKNLYKNELMIMSLIIVIVLNYNPNKIEKIINIFGKNFIKKNDKIICKTINYIYVYLINFKDLILNEEDIENLDYMVDDKFKNHNIKEILEYELRRIKNILNHNDIYRKNKLNINETWLTIMNNAFDIVYIFIKNGSSILKTSNVFKKNKMNSILVKNNILEIFKNMEEININLFNIYGRTKLTLLGYIREHPNFIEAPENIKKFQKDLINNLYYYRELFFNNPNSLYGKLYIYKKTKEYNLEQNDELMSDDDIDKLFLIYDIKTYEDIVNLFGI